MARNLGQTSCARCGKAQVIKPTERPRPITQEEAGAYFDEYEGMLVAEAACWICGARYLAWVDERPRVRPSFYVGGVSTPRYAEPVPPYTAGGYFDLSYRSTFNNEPGSADLPPWDPDAVETLCTEALFLIDRALASARKEPDRRISQAQINNLHAAHHELLGAWDCRNDYPRHGPTAAERSRTAKFGGTGATFVATLTRMGQLWISEQDRGETQWWTMPDETWPETWDGFLREVGAYVVRVLSDKLEVLRAEGRLY